jgi:hypothetical protein
MLTFFRGGCSGVFAGQPRWGEGEAANSFRDGTCEAMNHRTRHYRNNVKTQLANDWISNGLRYIIYQIPDETPPCPISPPTNPA